MTDWPVVELRQYTLRPGGFPVLADLFDQVFTDELEACGMRVVGQFADLDDPDRFVWLRAFPDLERRTAALREFYEDGHAWRTHREAANATMTDSDDVLLLRPVQGDLPETAGHAMITATVCLLPRPVDDAVRAHAAEHAPPGTPLGLLETEPGPNGFPRLPVREGENAIVWLTGHTEAEPGPFGPPDPFSADLARRWDARVARLRLAPLARSRMG
ncbi:NIPSNAP family protein [Actinokineospora sp. 24-640]